MEHTLHVQPEGYLELHEVGSQSPSRPSPLVGFKLRTFQFCVYSFLTLILKLSNVTHLIKININMNLSIQSLTFYLLFFIFHEKETFQKLWKIVFISSNKHLLFLRYSMFCFSLFFPVFRFKGLDQKINFSKRIFQLKETGN